MSEAISKEEMRELFLDQIRVICDYWANESRQEDIKGKIDGAAFSMLNMFDGCSGGFPCAVDLVMRPHEDDKQFNIDGGDDYVLDGQVINDDCYLHDLFYKE